MGYVDEEQSFSPAPLELGPRRLAEIFLAELRRELFRRLLIFAREGVDLQAVRLREVILAERGIIAANVGFIVLVNQRGQWP